MTLDDVAAEAGVSPKTVSRVLNNEPNVRDTTRKRVLDAADKLGYRPNPAARSLASSKSYTIAHLHDNPDRDYISRLNSGIYRACKESNYFLFVEPLNRLDENLNERITSFLATSGVDGVVLSPPLTDYQPLIGVLQEKQIPVVAISPESQRDHVASVGIDERDAASIMTRHLLALGHSKIGYIAGPAEHGSAARRREGFLSAIEAAGIRTDQCPQDTGDFSFRSGLEAATRLLQRTERPSAIFAASDEMAAGAMTAAFQLGLQVPEHISIAGFDASHIGETIWPPLSTIRQPVSLMAERAARWLISGNLYDEDKPRREEFACELITRPSTAQA